MSTGRGSLARRFADGMQPTPGALPACGPESPGPMGSIAVGPALAPEFPGRYSRDQWNGIVAGQAFGGAGGPQAAGQSSSDYFAQTTKRESGRDVLPPNVVSGYETLGGAVDAERGLDAISRRVGGPSETCVEDSKVSSMTPPGGSAMAAWAGMADPGASPTQAVPPRGNWRDRFKDDGRG